MKARIAIVLAGLALAGCVAVPVGHGDPYGRHGYYGSGVYVEPSVSFRYRYGSGYDGRYRGRGYYGGGYYGGG